MASPFLPVPAAYRGGLSRCPLDVPDSDRAQLCDRGAGRDAEPDECSFSAHEGSQGVPACAGLDTYHGSHPRERRQRTPALPHPDDGAAWHAKWEKLRQA
ncbi:hypothetical protein AT275_05145 [Bacillus cereus]|nr:hypothetical protein AT275_05145 [Bacillus cereus]